MIDDRIAWTWRHAICKSDLPPTTRHVLHALSCWMNEVGGSCYPTTKELATATGLSERAVCEHLEKAEGWGWLKRRRHGFKGRGYRRHEYEAAFPGSGRGPESEPDEVDSEGENADGALTQDQQVSDDALTEDQQAKARRTDPDDTDALTQDQRLRRPVHSPVQCSQACACAPDDDARLDDDRLREILIEAAGPAARPGAKGLGSVAVIRKWLDLGADLQRDIVPAIREKASTMKPGALRSWRFMDGPIGDWMQDRKDNEPAKSTECKPFARPDPATFTDKQWRFRVGHWLNGGPWVDGPMPGDPDCTMPAELVAEFKRRRGGDVFEIRKAKAR